MCVCVCVCVCMCVCVHVCVCVCMCVHVCVVQTFFLLLVAVLLVLRTYADVWMIQNGTAIEGWGWGWEVAIVSEEIKFIVTTNSDDNNNNNNKNLYLVFTVRIVKYDWCNIYEIKWLFFFFFFFLQHNYREKFGTIQDSPHEVPLCHASSE